MNLNMPFENDDSQEKMTIEEFESTKLTTEESVDELTQFIDDISRKLHKRLHNFNKVQIAEVEVLLSMNSRNERHIKELNEQIETYRIRLIKLQGLSEDTTFNKTYKEFEANFKYYARL